MAHKKVTNPTHTQREKDETSILKICLKNWVFWLFFICLVAGGAIVRIHITPLHGSQRNTKTQSALFVGDIMLGRNVETLTNTHGRYYPFKGVRDMLAGYDAVVGNFEASIPETHVHTPSMTFTLSVAEEAAEALARVGFTHMTLANNHSGDFGEKAYAHTRETLSGADIAVGGNPRSLSSDEVLYYTIDDVTVAIIPINTIFTAPTLEESAVVITETAEKSDLQIVFIHWGDEYETVANENQRARAHALVDAGADVIIGHHPHVVQDIEEYRGAAIFYSLGNFIFDQYWNENVQVGLTVALSFKGANVRYTLVPVTSVDTRSAPRPMNRVERRKFLDILAARGEQSIANAVKEGVIVEIFR